jgi:hypothetical protein
VFNVNTDIREALKPCIKVISGKYHRSLLRTIIDAYHKETSGKTTSKLCEKAGVESTYLYNLYKLGGFKSKSKVEAALKDLVECGYLTCVKVKVKGRKRKIYRPTPLGVLMNLILTLLYPEESEALKLHESFAVYYTSGFIAQETFFDILPYMFHLTILLTSPQPSKIFLLAKGWLTAEYAADLVAIRLATKVDWNIFPRAFLRIPLVQERLWGIVEGKMRDRLRSLEDLKERGVEELVEVLSEVYKGAGLELPAGVKGLLSQAIEHLHKNFETLCRSISTYRDIKLKKLRKIKTFKLESY